MTAAMRRPAATPGGTSARTSQKRASPSVKRFAGSRTIGSARARAAKTALAVPVWRRLTALWHWLNVKILMQMFRPLRRLGRWVVRHVAPPFQRLVGQLRQLLARLEPVLVRLTQGVEAVERAAARLAASWHRLWAPVLVTVARWRRQTQPADRS